MKYAKYIHWLLYPLFALSCARQTTPTGGPKDTIPPTLISSIPKPGQTHFKGKSIQLTLSEAILLNNPKEQLIITPDIGKDVEFKSKKNQVFIDFTQDLKDSTTYTINFRDAIQDITEKNPAAGLKLAFSTGSYVDSLSIQGQAFDPLTNQEMKEATVGLYQSDTFNIFLHRPTYLTKTDKQGNFLIENLKAGKYYIYGIQDKNKNLIVDSKTESYAFLQNPIQLSADTSNIKLPFVRLDSRPLKLTSARPTNTYYNIRTSKSLTTYNLSSSETQNLVSSFGEDFANVRVYKTFQDRDSSLVHFLASDSVDNTIDTTLYVKFSNREVTPEKFDFALNDFRVIANKGTLSGRIKFTKPVATINFDSIFYTIDSTHQVSFRPEHFSWDSLTNTLTLIQTIDKNLLSKKSPSNQAAQPIKVRPESPKTTSPSNELYLGYSAFISVEGDSSKRSVERATPAQLEETGVILVETNTAAENFIIQLLSKDFQIIDSKTNKKKTSFEDLKPGDYQLRLIIDQNNNGKWDPGNYFKGIEPEKIIHYRNEKNVSTVNLKANWELGPLLITD